MKNFIILVKHIIHELLPVMSTSEDVTLQVEIHYCGMVNWWRWQVASMVGITGLDWILSHPLASGIILVQGF
jgi:hypothetical protein